MRHLPITAESDLFSAGCAAQSLCMWIISSAYITSGTRTTNGSILCSPPTGSSPHYHHIRVHYWRGLTRWRATGIQQSTTTTNDRQCGRWKEKKDPEYVEPRKRERERGSESMWERETKRKRKRRVYFEWRVFQSAPRRLCNTFVCTNMASLWSLYSVWGPARSSSPEWL